MTDGLLLRAGPGRRIQAAAMTPTVGAGQPQAWPAFEAEAAPGYVGAHLHNEAGELCHILDGEPDRPAFEPLATTAGTWRGGEPAGGARVLRGGYGLPTIMGVSCWMSCLARASAIAAGSGGPARPMSSPVWSR